MPLLRKACSRPWCCLLLQGVCQDGQAHVCHQQASCRLLDLDFCLDSSLQALCQLANDCQLPFHVSVLDSCPGVLVQSWWNHQRSLHPNSCCGYQHSLSADRSKCHSTPASGAPRLRAIGTSFPNHAQHHASLHCERKPRKRKPPKRPQHLFEESVHPRSARILTYSTICHRDAYFTFQAHPKGALPNPTSPGRTDRLFPVRDRRPTCRQVKQWSPPSPSSRLFFFRPLEDYLIPTSFRLHTESLVLLASAAYTG